MESRAAVMVSISALFPGYSPRVRGEDVEHIRILSETQDVLPPIVVHRTTMRVIDGMHRLRAAVARGDAEILVEFFEGSADDAFVRAVQDNVQHGLPLSRADREAAVLRLIRSHNGWSNRAIAVVTGLSAPTVGSIRRRMTDKSFQSNKRVGRDGRERPVSGAEGRLRASTIIQQRPDASLRVIAREAGISLSTAQDVKKRLQRGEDPLPAGMVRRPVDLESTMATLRRDPSLRFTQTGRTLLQWLGVHAVDHEQVADAVPGHCSESVADLARACADVWTRLADELEHRDKQSRDKQSRDKQGRDKD